MKKLLALLLFVSSYAFGGSITGQIQTATSGPIVSGTLTFSLSQSAVQVGSGSIVTSPVACYTDRGGNIVSQPDPLVAPIVTTNTGSGTLASGTYFTQFSYYDASGVGMASFETTTVLASTGTLIVAPPVLRPATATGWKIYISSASGTETLQSTQVGFGSSYQQSSALSAGSALSVSNTSVCKVLFSDQLIPSYTSYNVSFVNSSGSNVSGFPQRWYLSGGAAGTVNISNGTPLYSGIVVYPQAIITTPAFNATQSIAGPLSLGSFGLTAASITNTGTESVAGTASFSGSVSIGAPRFFFDVSTPSFRSSNTAPWCWTSSAFGNGTCDTGLSRDSAGVVDLGNGTQGSTNGTLKLNIISIPRGSDGTLPATITNDTAGGINLTTNGGKTWEVANGGNLASPLGGQLQLNGATSGAIGLAVPSIAGSNVWTIPAATDTAVGKATTDTITNKTPGSPWNGVACGNGGADFCLPIIVGTPVHLTGINANVGATNVFAAPATGLYIWSCNCRTTTAGSGTTATFTLAFANEAGAQTFTSGTFALNSTTFATGTVSFNLPIHLNSGTAATFAVNGTWGTSVAACDSFLLREN